MYEGMNGVGPGGMMHPMGPPMEMRNTEDPPDEESKIDDNKSTASGTSFLMGGAQNRLKQKKAERIRKMYVIVHAPNVSLLAILQLHSHVCLITKLVRLITKLACSH